MQVNAVLSNPVLRAIRADFEKVTCNQDINTNAKPNTDVTIMEWESLLSVSDRCRLRWMALPTTYADHQESYFSPLKQVVQDHFAWIQASIPQISWHLKTLLYQVDPGEHARARGLQQLSDSSVEKYGKIALALVVFLVRVSCLHPEIVSKETHASVKNLTSYPTVENVQNLIIQHVCCVIPYTTKESDIVMKRFMILLGCNIDGSIRAPKHLTSPLAMIKYVLRAAIMMECHQKPESVATILEFLKRGNHSPFTIVTQQLALLYHLAKNDSSPENIYWLDIKNWMKLNVRGVELSLCDISSVEKSVFSKAIMILNMKILLGAKSLIGAKFVKLMDDFNNQQNGYSFVSDSRNDLKDIQFALLNIMSQDGKFMMLQEGNIRWKEEIIKNWLHECDQFLTMLLVLIHISSGMPSRASELSTLQIQNTIASERSIYIYGDSIMLVQVLAHPVSSF